MWSTVIHETRQGCQKDYVRWPRDIKDSDLAELDFSMLLRLVLQPKRQHVRSFSDIVISGIRNCNHTGKNGTHEPTTELSPDDMDHMVRYDLKVSGTSSK